MIRSNFRVAPGYRMRRWLTSLVTKVPAAEISQAPLTCSARSRSCRPLTLTAGTHASTAGRSCLQNSQLCIKPPAAVCKLLEFDRISCVSASSRQPGAAGLSCLLPRAQWTSSWGSQDGRHHSFQAVPTVYHRVRSCAQAVQLSCRTVDNA